MIMTGRIVLKVAGLEKVPEKHRQVSSPIAIPGRPGTSSVGADVGVGVGGGAGHAIAYGGGSVGSSSGGRGSGGGGVRMVAESPAAMLSTSPGSGWQRFLPEQIPASPKKYEL